MDLVDALAAMAERASRLPTPLQRLHSWLRQGELARKRGKHNLAAAIGRGVMKQLETHSAGQFLLNERLQALELVAQTPQDISPELAELSLYQPQVAYRLINQSN
ncbi:MAG: hypothetical protein D6758_10465 [Gammaproteobacteria bacterium]|nr:MAG: hypothetical protein D6758_10465 [Gammaproteobacteria bacterium]